MKKFLKYAAAVVVGFVIGWSVHWTVLQEKPVAITATDEKPLPGGGRQLSSAADPDAKPAQPMPLGAQPLHVGAAVVVPKAKKKTLAGADVGGKGVLPATDGGTTDGTGVECGPIEVRYTLYRDLDGQERVRMDSPDGEVVSGHDLIVEVAKVRPDMPWAFGVGVTADGRYGARVDRDFNWAPLRASLQLQQAEDGRHVDPSAWLILRF